MDENDFIVYTDGSCLGNPGPGGIGIVITFPADLEKSDETSYRGFKVSTNNRMELKAGIEALKLVRTRKRELGHGGKIFWLTDSQYITENINNVPSWRRNSWIKSNGEPVLNDDLWHELHALRFTMRISPGWIPREQNKAADGLARLGSRSPTHIDFGYNPGRIGFSIGGRKGAPSFFTKDMDGLRIRIYKGDGEVSRRDGKCKIRFEIYEDDELNKEKYYAYATSEIYNQLHRNNTYTVNVRGGNITEVSKTSPRT